METEFKQEPVKVESEKGYIKLTKNETSKGVLTYAWDIKAVESDNHEPLKKLVLLLEELNDQMLIRFGGNAS